MKRKLKYKRTDKTKKFRSLLTHSLENISKLVFKEYYNLITNLIGSSPGIYALYDGSDLYYVGKSTDLRKRVKQHLRDRHFASWTHFSLYLVRRAEHISEIESLIVRITHPKGNVIKPKGKSSTSILAKLKALVKQKQQEEFVSMFGDNSRNRSHKQKAGKRHPHPESLKGLVKWRTRIYKTYKGKEYMAYLTRGGKIIFRNKKYSSPTAAALAIVDRKTVNGWRFWDIRNPDGEWVKLCDYKK
jgi:hypothetical protein